MSILLVDGNVDLIDFIQRKLEEIVFVFPCHLALCKALALRRGGRWVRDLGDQIRSRGLSNSVHENTDEWELQNNGKAKCEAK